MDDIKNGGVQAAPISLSPRAVAFCLLHPPAGCYAERVEAHSKLNLVLVGFMGSGKSTVGRGAAAELQTRFVDMDRVIEEREGLTISEIFSLFGEPSFRQIEAEVAEELSREKGLVIATGGGVVLRPSNLEHLARQGILIHLRVNLEGALARTRSHSHRPLLRGEDAEQRARRIFAERQPLYESIPHHVDTTNHPTSEVVAEVVRLYRQEVARRKSKFKKIS